MKSFKQIIGASAEALRETRVKNVVRNTAAASKSYIENKKQEFRDLQSRIEDHLDLGITNTTDVATNLKGFEPQPWCENLHSMSEELAIKAAKINISVNVHNKLFPEDPVTGLTTDDMEFIKDTCGISIAAGAEKTEE